MLKQIKRWFRLFFWGLKSADSTILNTTKNNITSDATINQQLEADNVYSNLINGELTQEVQELRHVTYVVDREAKNYSYIGNGQSRKKSMTATKYNAVEELEGYPIQLIQDNTMMISNVLDELNKVGNYGNWDQFLIKICRNGFTPRFRLEEFTKKLVVKRINDTDVQLDFYTPIYMQSEKRYSPFLAELQKIINGDIRRSDIIEFDSVSFFSHNAFNVPDMHDFCYINVKYMSTSIFDGNYVIKFIATIEKDGIDLMEQYKNNEMLKKYENKELKKNAHTLSFNDGIEMIDNGIDVSEAKKLINELKNKI